LGVKASRRFPLALIPVNEVADNATERAIQTLGGWGYITDHPVEKWYRDAKLYTIFEDTSGIQRMVIAQALGASEGAPPCKSRLSRPAGR
jgi:alkylation response protein AidB-like acyl-CoA dehydrogenase